MAGGRSTKVVSDDHLVLPLVQPAFAVRRDSNNVTANFVALPVDEVDELGLNHRLSRIIQSRRVFVALGPCSSLALNRAQHSVCAVGARGDGVYPVRAQRHVSDRAAVAGKLLGVGWSGPCRDAADGDVGAAAVTMGVIRVVMVGGGTGVLLAAFCSLFPGPLGLGAAVGVVSALGAIRRRVVIIRAKREEYVVRVNVGGLARAWQGYDCTRLSVGSRKRERRGDLLCRVRERLDVVGVCGCRRGGVGMAVGVRHVWHGSGCAARH